MSAQDPKYAHDGQQRLLKVLLELAGHEITGITPSQVATALQITPSSVTRDLANLQIAGFAELVPETGRWRLAPQIVQIAVRHMAALDRAQSRLSEVRDRYSRNTDPISPATRAAFTHKDT